MIAALAGGCGDSEGMPAVGAEGEPGEGGTLIWALDGRVREVDPLLARNRAERLVARQVYEPLVDRLAGPFEDPRRVDGLALRVGPTQDPTVWRASLRQGVRFQDGTRFNAAAVLANVARWRATAAGDRLLPRLFEVDAPRPHLVRFILTAPDPDLAERLASPRLGIVSPRALGANPAALGGRPLRAEDAGTGPFDLRERERDRLLLARNTTWWGSDQDLGPALDQLQLLPVARAAERVALLRDGDAQVADGIPERGARRLRADPLLTLVPQPGGRWRGVDRSVRGVSGGGLPTLQQAWLTSLGRG